MSTNRMTVQHINCEIVRSQIHRLEHLIQSHHLPVDFTHSDLAICLEAFLDEPQQMFLVHAGGRVDVSVDLRMSVSSMSEAICDTDHGHLSHVVEVSVRHRFLLGQFSDFIEKNVKFVL